MRRQTSASQKHAYKNKEEKQEQFIATNCSGKPKRINLQTDRQTDRQTDMSFPLKIWKIKGALRFNLFFH